MNARILRLAILVAVPILALVAGEIGARDALRRNPEDVRLDLERSAARLRDFFEEGLVQASDVARVALDRSSPSAGREFSKGPFGRRLEGVGIADPEGRFVSWDGLPQPLPRSRDGRIPGFAIRVDGLTARLIAARGPDAEGRWAAASFVLDAPGSGRSLASLLPRSLALGPLRRIEFLDADIAAEGLGTTFDGMEPQFRAGPPASLVLPFRSPEGAVLAVATIEETPAERVAAGRRGTAAALAATFACLLLLGALDWRRACSRSGGAAAALAAIAMARFLLLVARAPSRILPREVAAASDYGSAVAWGLLGSPADLLLTALACWLAAAAIGRWARAERPARAGLVASVAGVAAASLLAAVAAISVNLAESSRAPLLRLDASSRSVGQALLLAGLSLLLLGSTELALTAVTALRRRGRDGPAPPVSRFAVGLALLVPVAISSALLLRTSDRLAQERLRSEFAPQVLEQASRRRVALVGAVRAAARSERALEAVSQPEDRPDENAAYLLWVDGDLFHSGLKSSLDLYGASAGSMSRFAFDLPLLEEPSPSVSEEPIEVAIRTEEIAGAGAIPQRLLHAEAAVLDPSGARVGSVVGHVLDEPDNLPFLPGSSAFLSALGPGAPGYTVEDPQGVPDYVLYDGTGVVALSTLRQPPAAEPRFRQAARNGHALDLEVASQPYRALPLVAGEGLHLLLLPRLTWIDRLGAFVRLALLPLGWLALASLFRGIFRPGSLGALVVALRASFQRKLVATLLAASLIPLLGLAVVVRQTIERRAESDFANSAVQLVTLVGRVVKDYAALQPGDRSTAITDEILQWLRHIVRQDIHVYEDGVLAATSRRDLFASGYLPPRLPGEVYDQVVVGRAPHIFRSSEIGSNPIPTVYAGVRFGDAPEISVVAVPLVRERKAVERALARVTEMLLLVTVLLAALLSASAAVLARTVARPVRELVGAAARIATGEYGARLRATTRDELRDLVDGFNAMAAALAEQRADLLRRRDYMEALLSNATTGVLSTDALGRIVTFNPAAATLLWAPGENDPQVGALLVEAIRRAPDLAPLSAALAPGASPTGEPFDVDLSRAGKSVRLRVVRVPLPDPDGGESGSLVLLDDVTDMMRSNQLEAWAEMARSIAHEIKNPLTPIQLSVEHLRRLLLDRLGGPEPEIDTCLDTVLKQVRALREIATEFSAYAKLPTLEPVATDPVAFLREIAESYRAGKPEGIEIEESYAPSPKVAIDRRVLARALVNLVENALQAMEGGGRLTLATGPDGAGGTFLSVSDTGPGLHPAIRQRLFEPYFSTKSSGTGLGLAIVRRAVEAHGGSIEVSSLEGVGTTFRIRLPGDSSLA